MSGICDRCKEECDELRHLYMRCGYNMGEMGIDFNKEIFYQSDQQALFYKLTVCKVCRAEWMAYIQAWFIAAKIIDVPCGSGIYIRRLGIEVEITEEEWKGLYPDREPVRIKKMSDDNGYK